EKGQTNADSLEEDRVGQDRDPEEVEQHGGVAKPGGGQPIVRPVLRMGTDGRGRNRAAQLPEPFAPEMGDPIGGSVARIRVRRHALSCLNRSPVFLTGLTGFTGWK